MWGHFKRSVVFAEQFCAGFFLKSNPAELSAGQRATVAPFCG
jgi:hypothetical protein